jgi:2-oxoglutarate ferredoxin oxidoreductase subunit alpha
MYTWKIGGEAGFGINAAGAIFSKFVSRSGYYAFDYIEYPSLIRGGHNALEVVISSEDNQRFLENKIDCLVCLNKETYQKHSPWCHQKSLILYDQDDFIIEGDQILINIPLKKILNELGGNLVMRNTIMLGASIALLGGEIEILLDILKDQFEKKGESVISFNQKFAQAGYDYVTKNYVSLINPILKKKTSTTKLVISGNEAFSLGVVLADCRFYAAYPMTPSSSVLHTLAAWQKETGMVVRHAEDEIAVINNALGASFAGVRAAVGTSGGGFSLMVESISLAGITETPIVIFLAQRPGPATGMPTWTEQGDLLFAIFAGHGEFPKIVLSPANHEEMIKIGAEAFNLADIYQTPVIVLSDMYLSESHATVDKEIVDQIVSDYQVNRGKLVNNFILQSKLSAFLRYQITDDGISERLLPGTPGFFYQANSYEHIEDGHTTEDDIERKKQVEKRNKKMDVFLKNHFQPPKIIGDIDKAEIIFISWGSTQGVISQAIKQLEEKNINTALIHFTYLFPMDKKKIKPLLAKNKRYILVENNSHGQFGQFLKMISGAEINERILKYDGRPIRPFEIVSYIINL